MSEFDMPARIKRLRLPPGRRIIAVSDIHGNLPYLKGLLKKIRFDADDILIIDGDFLEKGPDSLGTLRYIMQLSEAGNIYTVCGNCDGWGCDYEDDMLVNIGGVNIFVTHGHRYGVKSGLDTLTSAAAAKGAQVACFGHTHKPFCEYRDGVLLINPGTCTLRGACALLTIDQSGSFQAELL